MDLNLDRVDWQKAKEIFAPEKESFIKRAKGVWERYQMAEEALRVVAGFGAVSLMLMIPPLAITVGRIAKYKDAARYKKMWKRWEEQKLVTIKETPEGPVVEITQAGIKRALKYKLSELKVKKPDQWDKKWRVVIFDVPETKKSKRNYFRDNLKALGFYQLNKSVFIFPYSCFNEIEYLRQISGIGDEVTYLTADSVETSSNLKTYFGLV